MKTYDQEEVKTDCLQMNENRLRGVSSKMYVLSLERSKSDRR